jgi:hypothetical protein
MNPDPSFDQLFEGYLFKVAITLVDSMSPPDQTNLIKLINQVGKTSEKDTSSGKQPPARVTEKLTASPLEHLESQWQIALKESLPSIGNLAKDEKNALLSYSHRLTQQQIASTLTNIERMSSLIERAKSGHPGSSTQGYLLSHYQGIRGRFTNHLIKLKALHEDRLSRLTR